MRDLVLTGLRSLELRESPPPPAPGAGEVQIAIESVGVCGSDVHYYTEGRIGSQVVVPPFRVGHECGGRVAAVGPGVRRVKPGDRVAVDPAISCEACDQCREGRPHTCRALRFLGCPGQVAGCLCDRINMPEACCFPVSDSFTPDRTALIEPVAIGCYAARRGAAPPATPVAILGCGPIGLSVLLALRQSGHAGGIWMADPIAPRAVLARELGAAWSGTPAELPDHAPAGGFGCVFECCGQQEALDQGARLLRPGGRLVVVGIPAVDRVSFPIDTLRRNEIDVLNIRRQNGCVEAGIDLLAGPLGPVADRMVTHRFAPDGAAEAFALAARYGDGIVKAMIEFGG